jgi:oxygen-independent coproporphyrinogen-3 oxidase
VLPRPFGVYVHFPYCPHICPYCDFAVRKQRDIPQQRFTDAVVAELRLRAAGFAQGRRAVSVYLGGGTPSLWEPACVRRVLDEVRALFELSPAPEVTLEANPEAADEARLRAYRDAGVTRLSIGVQSFEPARLQRLGRVHTAEQAEAAFAHARAAGFAAVSVDLIHGSEGQTALAAAEDARRAAALGADHVSAYALTLTNLAVDVPMARAVRRGLVVLPDDDEQQRMSAQVRAALEAAGLHRYEISNFARPGFESVHNSLYWTGAEYVAVGPGACGFSLDRSGGAPRGVRYANDRSALRFMDLALEGRLPEAQREELGAQDLLRERLFTGLRLVRGVDLDELSLWSGLPVRERYQPVLERLQRDGLAALDGAQLRLTERGLDLHSEAALRFF